MRLPRDRTQCPACGGEWDREEFSLFCIDCSFIYEKLKILAHLKVKRAIYKGELPKAKTLICVDCGKPAACYDHRYYSKPLAVDSVCWPCNHRRGQAIDAIDIVKAKLLGNVQDA